MDIATVSSALAGLNSLVNIATDALAKRDDAKLSTALKDLNQRVIDTQLSVLQLMEKNSSLQDECESLKNESRSLKSQIFELTKKADDRNKYRLHETADGVFVYAFQTSGDDPTPFHYICQPCMDNSSKKGVLKLSPNGSFHTCPICNNQYAARGYSDEG